MITLYRGNVQLFLKFNIKILKNQSSLTRTGSVDPLWSDFITASYKDWIEQNLNLDHQKLGIPEDLANQLLAGWISSLIENWITQDDPVPCKQFSKTFLNLVSSPLTSFAAYDSPAGPSNKIVIA